MDTKFTQGAWTIQDDASGCLYIHGADGDICDLYFKQEFEDETILNRFNNAEANARLIAAAPDMYSMLESIYKAQGWSDVGELLAKARGEES